LYRPNTKKGDPRVWFKGLGTYANANDILAIIAFRRELYVLNLTSLDLVQLIESDSNNPVKELIEEINASSRLIADELLDLLNKVASRGAILHHSKLIQQ
jgi:hypothetical protein